MGKTYGNLMVDLQATNSKLTERAKRIVCALTQLSPDEAAELLKRCGGEVKTAIVAHRLGKSPEEARELAPRRPRPPAPGAGRPSPRETASRDVMAATVIDRRHEYAPICLHLRFAAQSVCASHC